MNTQNQNGYMLLFRGTELRKSLSPEEMQRVSEKWMAWFRRLTEEGKAVAGSPLEREGKIVSGKDRIVSDGPFAESKEAIGGYFLLDVATKESERRSGKKRVQVTSATALTPDAVQELTTKLSASIAAEPRRTK